MNKIKIKFVDYWPNHHLQEDIIYKWLINNYDVEISDNPDYIFYSCFGYDFLKYNCVRIFYTAENIAPNFNECDYAISFEKMKFDDRNIQFPNFMKYKKELELIKSSVKLSNLFEREFCSFVVSNGYAKPIREELYKRLNDYKTVASGGKFMNNVGGPVTDKLEFQKKFKFSIACENSSHIGYTTEKILQAYASQTIPIYWGDPKVTDYFNSKTFINISDFENLDTAVEYIKEVNENKELYLKYFDESPWAYENIVDEKMIELDSFLANIFNQNIEKAFRRCDSQIGQKFNDNKMMWKHYYDIYRNKESKYDILWKLLNKILK